MCFPTQRCLHVGESIYLEVWPCPWRGRERSRRVEMFRWDDDTAQYVFRPLTRTKRSRCSHNNSRRVTKMDMPNQPRCPALGCREKDGDACLGNTNGRVQGRTKWVFPPRDAYMSEKVYILRDGVAYGVAERGLVVNNSVGGMTTPLNICVEHRLERSGQGAVTTSQDV